MAKWNLTKIMQNQGFGGRKDCTNWIKKNGLIINGETIFDPKAQFETEGLIFTVGKKEWLFRDQIYILMNKPLNTECSRRPSHHPSILGLLPSPIIAREVQSVGRLDVETTGALLITNDGQFNHKMTSPKKNVPKIYIATLKHEITSELPQRLMDGVLLHDEDEIICAEEVEKLDSHTLKITLFQGKYHQVRRMVAAASNRVEQLHRESYGHLSIKDLELGEWKFLTPEEAYGPHA